MQNQQAHASSRQSQSDRFRFGRSRVLYRASLARRLAGLPQADNLAYSFRNINDADKYCGPDTNVSRPGLVMLAPTFKLGSAGTKGPVHSVTGRFC